MNAAKEAFVELLYDLLGFLILVGCVLLSLGVWWALLWCAVQVVTGLVRALGY